MLTVAVSYEIELQKIIVLNPKDGTMANGYMSGIWKRVFSSEGTIRKM